MPAKPRKPCCRAGCSNFTRERYCDQHKREAGRIQDRDRGTSTERGYDARWRRLRDWYIQQHPLCAECGRQGRVVPANEVDHITPHCGNDALRLDASNLQALCKPCHSKKTASENGGFGNTQVTSENDCKCGMQKLQ